MIEVTTSLLLQRYCICNVLCKTSISQRTRQQNGKATAASLTLVLSVQLITAAFIPNIHLPLTVPKQLCRLLRAWFVKSVPEKLKRISGRARQRRESPCPALGRTNSTSTSPRTAVDHPMATNRRPGQSRQLQGKAGHCTHSAGPHQGASEMERAEFSFKLLTYF